MQKNTQKILISDEFSLDNYLFPLVPGDRVFFYGDLGAGKSTFIRHILRHHFHDPELIVRSPTYTYFQKYSAQNTVHSTQQHPVHHFDLYRIEDTSTLYSIGAMEILENPGNIALIEWPEIIEGMVTPTRKISIQILDDGQREVMIETLERGAS